VRFPSNEDAGDVNKAIIVFLAHHRASWPQQDEASLVRDLGAERAPALRAQVDALRGEMGAIEIDWTTHSLASGGAFARAEMRRRHPELSDEALDALAWEVTYNWK